MNDWRDELFWDAVREGKHRCARVLLDAGADANCTEDDTTVLMLGCANGHSKVCTA